MTRTRNSKRLTLRAATRHNDATTNSTKQNPKKIMQGSDWFGYDELTLIFFVAFSWTIGMKNRLDLNYEKL